MEALESHEAHEVLRRRRGRRRVGRWYRRGRPHRPGRARGPPWTLRRPSAHSSSRRHGACWPGWTRSGPSPCTRRWCRRLPAQSRLDIERFLHTGRRLLRSQVAAYLSWLRGRRPHGAARGAAAPLRPDPHALQRHPQPVRHVHRGPSPSAASTGPACGSPGSTRWPPTRCAVPPRGPRPAAAGRLPGPRPRRGDPPGEDQAARAATSTRSRSSGSPASAWSDTASRRASSTRSATRAPPCSGSSTASGRERAGGAAPSERWRGALEDLPRLAHRDRRRPRVGGHPRDRLHPGPPGGRQPAALLRLPAAGRRPPPDPLRPTADQRRASATSCTPTPQWPGGGGDLEGPTTRPTALNHRAQGRDLEGALNAPSPTLRPLSSSTTRCPPSIGGRTHAPPRCSRSQQSTTRATAHAVRPVWNGDVATMARQPPSLVFAAVGQARAAERFSAPEAESRILLQPAASVGSAQHPPRHRPHLDHRPARSMRAS